MTGWFLNKKPRHGFFTWDKVDTHIVGSLQTPSGLVLSVRFSQPPTLIRQLTLFKKQGRNHCPSCLNRIFIPLRLTATESGKNTKRELNANPLVASMQSNTTCLSYVTFVSVFPLLFTYLPCLSPCWLQTKLNKRRLFKSFVLVGF